MNYRKIAQLANVSASTVSKALSGSAEIRAETAERIRQIAIDTGYFKEKSKRKREYANDGYFFDCCDNQAIIEDSVRYLAELGHKKIGFVGEPYTAAAANFLNWR